MSKTKTKTYFDKLMLKKEFRDKFEQEYQNLTISEEIAKLRHEAHLAHECIKDVMDVRELSEYLGVLL